MAVDAVLYELKKVAATGITKGDGEDEQKKREKEKKQATESKVALLMAFGNEAQLSEKGAGVKDPALERQLQLKKLQFAKKQQQYINTTIKQFVGEAIPDLSVEVKALVDASKLAIQTSCTAAKDLSIPNVLGDQDEWVAFEQGVESNAADIAAHLQKIEKAIQESSPDYANHVKALADSLDSHPTLFSSLYFWEAEKPTISYEFKRGAEYNWETKKLTLTYTRTTKLSDKKYRRNMPEKRYTLGRAIDNSIVLKYKCDGDLKYTKDNDFFNGKKPVKCEHERTERPPVKKLEYFFNTAGDRNALAATQISISLPKDGPGATECAELKRQEAAAQAWLVARKKDANTLLQENDILDHDNKRTKFQYSRVSYENFVKADHTVWSFPGEMAGGVKNVCTKEMCYIKKDEWNRNFGYANNNGGIKSILKQDGYDTNEDLRKQVEANPFKWGLISGYSVNPIPMEFINIFLLCATVSNIGQSWMSAYVSKVLSSLWKNIAAALSLAAVVVVEKLILRDAYTASVTDVARVLIATLAVLLTVLVFQNAPKPPKKEEKPKEGDIETGDAQRAPAKRESVANRASAVRGSQRK
jgi:hypothetical protein